MRKRDTVKENRSQKERKRNPREKGEKERER